MWTECHLGAGVLPALLVACFLLQAECRKGFILGLKGHGPDESSRKKMPGEKELVGSEGVGGHFDL